MRDVDTDKWSLNIGYCQVINMAKYTSSLPWILYWQLLSSSVSHSFLCHDIVLFWLYDHWIFLGDLHNLSSFCFFNFCYGWLHCVIHCSRRWESEGLLEQGWLNWESMRHHASDVNFYLLACSVACGAPSSWSWWRLWCYALDCLGILYVCLYLF